MIDLQTLKNAIYTPLKKAGFMEKSQSLYLDGDDTILVINLQKSNWSKLYYINMGIWLKAYGDGLFPKFNHCHLYYRIEHFFPTKTELILTACNLGRSDLETLANLSEFIKHQLIPFLQDCTREGNLRDLMSQGILDGGYVKLEAKMFLSEK